MEVGAADAAVGDFEQDFAGSGFRLREVPQFHQARAGVRDCLQRTNSAARVVPGSYTLRRYCDIMRWALKKLPLWEIAERMTSA